MAPIKDWMEVFSEARMKLGHEGRGGVLLSRYIILYSTYPTRHGHRRLELRGWVATCGHRGGLSGCENFPFFYDITGAIGEI